MPPIPETDLLDDLRAVADDLGHPPSATQYQECGSYSVGVIRLRFDYWNDGLRKAGLDPRNGAIPEEDLLDDLRAVADDLDHSPTRREYEKRGRHSFLTIANRFGSWNEGLQEAGLDPRNGAIPDEDLLDDLRAVADDLGRSPTVREYNERGRFSIGAICNHFGSWNDGLREAGLETRPKGIQP